jgi:Mg-chelatase subunit ChlI
MNLEHLLQGQAGQKYITASNLAESQRGCKVRDGGGKKMERGKAHTVVGAAHHEEWRLEAHGEDWRRVEQQPSRTGEKRERAKQQQPGEEKRAAAARRGEKSSSSQERRGEESSSSQERRREQQQPGEEKRERAAAARSLLYIYYKP